MAAYEVLLLNTAIPQIQAAQSGDTYVVPRDIAFSAALTISAGTANGVPYLNGSKVVTTGSALTFDGSKLGVGTNNPGDVLEVVGSGAAGIRVSRSGASSQYVTISSGSTGPTINASTGVNEVSMGVNGAFAMRLDSSGNVGIGVTPSFRFHTASALYQDNVVGIQQGTGQTSGNQNRIQFIDQNGTTAEINAYGSAYGTGFSLGLTLGSNYLNTTALATTFNYSQNGFASRYRQVNSQHIWDIAPSGTAGNAITFTPAMTLNASGNLGLGTTNPTDSTSFGRALDIASSTGASVFVRNTANAAYYGYLGMYSTALFLYNNANGEIQFGTNNTERARITSGGVFQVSSGGSVQVGGTAARATTAGTNRLDIFNGTAPVGTLTNGISIYSSSGEAYVMDAAGNATLFSPHDTETNEWIFKSKHTPTGKVLKIDVERLLKFVNDHFGLDAVHEFVEE